MPTHRSAKLATAAAIAAAGLTLATGLAVAGVLPDQASDTAEDKVAENRPTTTTTSIASTTTTTAAAGAPGTDDVGSQGEGERPTDTHGYAVSGLATTTNLEGRDKGEAISDLASSNAQSDGPGTTGTVTAQEHQPTERGKSAEHRP